MFPTISPSSPAGLDFTSSLPYPPLQPPEDVVDTSEAILDELLTQSTRGKITKKKNLQVAFARELRPNDILLLTENRDSRISPLQKMRHSHHALAKLVADGVSNTECSLITGYAGVSISILKSDPAFKELVEYYKGQKDEIYIDVHQRLADLGLEVVDELRDRLHESPESFRIQDLNEISKTLLDRAGFGPKTTVNHNVGVAILNDETLSRIKGEAERRRVGAVREISGPGEVIDSIPVRPSPALCEAEEDQGLEGERAGLREEVHSVVEKNPP